MNKIFSILVAVLLSGSSLFAQEDVKLFNYWKYYSDVENALYKGFCKEAFAFLDTREAEIATLETESDWLVRQAEVREKLNRLIGTFPEKTPLNAKVVDVIKREDYKVEKIIYESVPGYYVTAGLFVPNNIKGKAPAIIYVSGHAGESFRSKTYQHVIINLVKKGFVVLAIDPMGQGERKQYLTPTAGKSKLGPTSEHSYVGAQCYISGYSPTKYFVWDGIRAVDYLLSRKDVDADRIGITGRSGGGTQTTYISAFDERIKAAAPECFITSMEYLLKSKGPQDAEQNLFHMLSEGLDHADFIEIRAPKPTMLITTTRDMFSIQGARDTYVEAKKAYKALGDEAAIRMVEDDYGHESTKKNREAMYAFFQETLDNPGLSDDREVEIFKEEDLWVTKTGQVMTSLGGESMYTLNKRIVESQMKTLESKRKAFSNSKIITSAKKATGFHQPIDFGKSIFSGRYVEDNYSIEKYMINGSGDYMLPIALIKPNNPINNKALLILSDKGMDYAVNEETEVLDLVKRGHNVIVFDIAGIGSLGNGYLRGDSQFGGASFNLWFGGILVDKSILGKRVEDILRVTHWIGNELSNYDSIAAVSYGALGSELLHASVFSDQIKEVYLKNPFLSFGDLALSNKYDPSLMLSSVAGAINDYDLIDLMAAYTPNKLTIINPIDVNGGRLDKVIAMDKASYPINHYKSKNASMSFSMSFGDNSVLKEFVKKK